MTTISRFILEGQEWHLYRRGEHGPLALHVSAPQQRAYIDITVSPLLLSAIQTMLMVNPNG